MAAGSKPFIELGGKSTGAVNAFREVQKELRKTAKEAKAFGATMKRSFSMGFAALTKIGSYIKNTMLGLFRRLKWVIAGFVSVVGGLTLVWNREAAAQARINTLLRANVQNFRQARKELDLLSRVTQRRTNYSDRDVEAVFVQFISQMGGRRGFGAARQMLPSVLDVASTLQMEPRMVAEAIARNIMAGTVGETFRKFGIRQNVERFRAMSVEQRIGATARDISRLAPGAAAAESRQNPIPRFLNNMSNIIEQIGRIFAYGVNPKIEAFARAAQDAADALAQLSPAESLRMMFDKFLAYSRDAWNFIRATAVVTWQDISAKFSEVIKDIQTKMAQAISQLVPQPIQKPIARAAQAAGSFFGKYTPTQTYAQYRQQQLRLHSGRFGTPPGIPAQLVARPWHPQLWQQRPMLRSLLTPSHSFAGATGTPPTQDDSFIARVLAQYQTMIGAPWSESALASDMRAITSNRSQRQEWWQAPSVASGLLMEAQKWSYQDMRRVVDNMSANRTRGALMPTG